jgi:hypothetical protein
MSSGPASRVNGNNLAALRARVVAACAQGRSNTAVAAGAAHQPESLRRQRKRTGVMIDPNRIAAHGL